MNTRLLVVGYGNELRRDDGVGPRVARIVASWELPGLRALALHQLSPELAEELAAAERVVFVDAGTNSRESVSLMPLVPASRNPTLGHTGDPAELLALTHALYGRRPSTWLLTLPAADLDFGGELSSRAMQGMETAVEILRAMADHLLTEERQPSHPLCPVFLSEGQVRFQYVD